VALRWTAVVGLWSFVVLAPCFAGAPTPAEEYLSQYKAGTQAIESGAWSLAVKHMRGAIAARPESRLRLPFHGYLHPYVPWYYLGVALFQLGDCEGALSAWQTARNQGVIRKRPRLEGDVQTKVGACRALEAQANEAQRESREWIQLAREAAAEVREMVAPPEISARWKGGASPLAERYEQARESLARAEKLASEGRGPRRAARYREAKSTAAEALSQFRVLRAEASRLLEEVEAENEIARAGDEILTALRIRAARALQRAPELDPYPRELASYRAALQRAIDASRQLGPRAVPAKVDGAAARLSTAIDRFQAAAAAPAPELVLAAEAWLRGDGDAVVLLLENFRFRDSRSRAHAHLLLAAARFNLFLEGGERDETLLESARFDARAARQMKDRLVLPARTFSPRFVRFFDRIPQASTPSGL